VTSSTVLPPVLVYDGDCGFCTASARQARRITPKHITIAASRGLDLSALGLSADECDAALQFVDHTGAVHSGAEAVASLLRECRGAWPLVGRTMSLPGVRGVAASTYRLVARNRHRLPGATASCAA
jgi:predicted DCC family thiol-disulfide oxidoreductase YuxK